MSSLTPLARAALAAALLGLAASCGGGGGDVQVGVGAPSLTIPTTQVVGGLANPRATIGSGNAGAIAAEAGADRVLGLDLSTGARETLADGTTSAGGTPAVDAPASLALLDEDLFIASLVDEDPATAGRIARIDLGAAPAAPAILDAGGLVHRPQGIDAATVALPTAGDRRVLFVASSGPDGSGKVVAVTLTAAGLAAEAYELALPAPAGAFPTDSSDLANPCDLAFIPAVPGAAGLVGHLFVVGLGPRADAIRCGPASDPLVTANPSYANDRVTMFDLAEDEGAPGRVRIERAVSKTSTELIQVVGIGVATARPTGVAPLRSAPGSMLIANRGNGFLSLVGRSAAGDLAFFSGLPALVDETDRSLAGINGLQGIDSLDIGAPGSTRDRIFVTYTDGASGSVRRFESLN